MSVGDGQRRSWILSIDFGTTSTVACAAFDGEVPQVLELDGVRSIPSIVVVDSERIFVGRSAERLANTRPAQTLRAPKARIGEPSPVVLNGRPYQVSTLIAAVLRWVYERATEQLGSVPRQVRMTYPATFSGSKISRLQDAADEAGLGEVVFVAEPIAATLWYSHLVSPASGSTVAVYDLGGGTLDIAVLQTDETGLRIIGRPLGDPSVGGELFDELMFNIIGGKLPPESWDVIQTASSESVQHLRAAIRTEATKCKEALSELRRVDAVIPLPAGMFAVTVSREEFETEIAGHVHDSVQLLRQCVLQSGVDPAALDEVQLVGGSSRIPAIADALRNEFPAASIHRRGDPVTAVALGAAIAPLDAVASAPQRFGGSGDDRVGPPVHGAANTTVLQEDRGDATVRQDHSGSTTVRQEHGSDTTVLQGGDRTVLMPDNREATQSRSRRHRKISIVVLAFALAAALVVVGIVLAGRRSSEAGTDASSTTAAQQTTTTPTTDTETPAASAVACSAIHKAAGDIDHHEALAQQLAGSSLDNADTLREITLWLRVDGKAGMTAIASGFGTAGKDLVAAAPAATEARTTADKSGKRSDADAATKAENDVRALTTTVGTQYERDCDFPADEVSAVVVASQTPLDS